MINIKPIVNPISIPYFFVKGIRFVLDGSNTWNFWWVICPKRVRMPHERLSSRSLNHCCSATQCKWPPTTMVGCLVIWKLVDQWYDLNVSKLTIWFGMIRYGLIFKKQLSAIQIEPASPSTSQHSQDQQTQANRDDALTPHKAPELFLKVPGVLPIIEVGIAIVRGLNDAPSERSISVGARLLTSYRNCNAWYMGVSKNRGPQN